MDRRGAETETTTISERGARGNAVVSSSQRRPTMGYRGLLFSGAVEAMIHPKRVTLMYRDLHLAICMRG